MARARKKAGASVRAAVPGDVTTALEAAFQAKADLAAAKAARQTAADGLSAAQAAEQGAAQAVSSAEAVLAEKRAAALAAVQAALDNGGPQPPPG